MKISLFHICLAFSASMTASGFTPMQQQQQFVPHSAVSRTGAAASSALSSKRFMAAPKSAKDDLEAEVERMVQEEIATKKKYSNLRNANGVEYAPWMGISREDEDKIRQLMKEKATARLKRQEEAQDVRGALLMDSQAQELSGVGLNAKIVNGNAVELEWATSSEKSTRGFLIKRRMAKSGDTAFEVIASHESYGPLASQGKDGGVYRYMDQGLSPGGYFYRVTECELSGAENDLSQCLVELQTAEEQQGAVIAAVGVVALLLAAVVGATLLDPMQ